MFNVRTFTGSLGFLLASVGSAAAIAVCSATPSLAANQALFLNGIGTASLPDLAMSNVLGGMFGSYQRADVTGPLQARLITGGNSPTLTESVSQAVTKTDAAIYSALTKIGPNEHVTVVGLSAGSLVADDELRKLLTSPNAPDKSKLTFVVVADSSRIPFNKDRFDPFLGYQYRTPPETKYDTVVVAAEYDGFADFPDRPWNIVAVANAIAGEIMTHVPSMFTDLSTVPAQNITTTVNSLGGVTTRYFVPAAHLPLVQLLPFLASQEAALRPIVDAGYARNDAKTAASVPAAATVTSPVTDPITATPAVTGRASIAPAAPAVVAPAATGIVPTVSPPAEPVVAPRLATLTEPTGVAESPVGRASAAATSETPHPAGHRGPGVHGSDRSADARSQTAKPAAAARTGNRPSA